MTAGVCEVCEGVGLWPFVLTSNPKADAEITADDLHFALCLCQAGMAFRETKNARKTVAPLWHVWCAKHSVSHERIHRLEDVVSAERLRAHGFDSETSPVDREAQLLAASRKPVKL